MSNVFSAIDLSKLSAPDVVETIDFETILAEWKADFLARHPEAAAELDLESEPVMKLMETGAYREVVIRQRVNDAARAVMTAFAQGTDQDHLAALIPLERKIIDPGDPEAIPPVDPTMEDNEEFRVRMQMAPEGFSTAGPDGAYIFHALSVASVRNASVASPSPGVVVVTVLGRDGDGIPDAQTIGEVETALSANLVRPFTDQVTTQAAQILTYTIEATLEFYDGPDKAVVLDKALEMAQAYADKRHALGDSITLSGVYAALHQEGVKKVNLTSPAADIAAQSHQAPYCTGITVTEAA